MKTRTEFLAAVAAFTSLKSVYNYGESQAYVMSFGAGVFVEAKLVIEAPVTFFVANGSVLWSIVAAMGCELRAEVHGDRATWVIYTLGPAEVVDEDEVVAKRVFGETT